MVGLIGPSGEALPLVLKGEGASQSPVERVLHLRSAEESFTFTDLAACPVPSLARDFSAPVKLRMDRSPYENRSNAEIDVTGSFPADILG